MATPTAMGSGERPRTFVEVALVRHAPGTVPRPPRGSETWLDAAGATVAWSAHLLASDQVPAKMRVAAVSSAEPCPAGERELTVTPQVQSVQPNRPGAVRLDVAITGTPPGASGCAETLEAHTTVVVQDQQTVLLAAQRPQGAVLAITPYLIRSEADLERLFECKRARRSAVSTAHE